MQRDMAELRHDCLDVFSVGACAATRPPLRLQFLVRMAKDVYEVVVHLHLLAELLLEFIDAYLGDVGPHTQYVGKMLDPDFIHDARSNCKKPEIAVPCLQFKAYQQQSAPFCVTLVTC